MPDGLWVGDQVSERVLKMDWNRQGLFRGRHNTAARSGRSRRLQRRGHGGGHPPVTRPFDKTYGEIVQCDMKTGKQIKGYRTPWGSSTVQDTNMLWAVGMGSGRLIQNDFALVSSAAHPHGSGPDARWIIRADRV